MSRTIVWLVASDPLIHQLISEQMATHQEIEIKTYPSVELALGTAALRPELLLLDENALEPGDLEKIPRAYPDLKMIVLTERTDRDQSYLTKPFRFSYLLEYMTSKIRTKKLNDDPLVIGPYLFRPESQVLESKLGNIQLTEKETRLLQFLLTAKDHTASREEILSEVWKYQNGVSTHTLETHIYRLRAKLNRDLPNQMILITEPGGYKLQA